MKHTMAFTRGPIVGPLLRFSMPILFALFLQALYGAVDLMVVGKFALAQDVSGVAAGFDYLKAYGIDCLLTCFLFCFIGFYNGLGRTGFVMLQGIGFPWLTSCAKRPEDSSTSGLESRVLRCSRFCCVSHISAGCGSADNFVYRE